MNSSSDEDDNNNNKKMMKKSGGGNLITQDDNVIMKKKKKKLSRLTKMGTQDNTTTDTGSTQYKQSKLIPFTGTTAGASAKETTRDMNGKKDYDIDEDDDDDDFLVDASASQSILPSTTTSLSAGGIPMSTSDAPPPGILNTLWYSRECFMDVWVVEKIIGWKLRHRTTLEWIPESLSPVVAEEQTQSKDMGSSPPRLPPTIETADAMKWSQMALTNPIIWLDSNKRMEVSRLVPKRCPIVAAMATAAQSSNDDSSPRFRIKESNTVATATTTTRSASTAAAAPNAATTENSMLEDEIDPEREEVYLVKWRGRSHMHVSWERPTDIMKLDQSKNTARHKIRRFVQSQELTYGLEWKQVLEDERATHATLHAHGETTTGSTVPPTATTTTSTTSTPSTVVDHGDSATEEEFFPPANIEIERILACDESEMDMTLFSKQRGLNVKQEQDRMKEKEQGRVRRWNSQQGLADLLLERPWDPEDNVRYVVKWKGLPFSDITWEYWRDIKKDAVDEAEDFWIRQRPPTPERVDALIRKEHPHIREFRKQQESPIFGLSQRKRVVADMGQTTDDDDSPTNTGFKLRSYQLEGVNWLLFNWWNRRSCILADEVS